MVRGGGRGDPLEIELTRRDLECKANECYQGFIVRTRLDRVSNEAVKHNLNSHREELQRFPFRHNKSVMSSNRHKLWSDQEICDTFQADFCDRFTRLPNLLVEVFSSYLANCIEAG